jgi:hypothetical protein
MKLVIQTQVYENYGAHTWDGKDECPQYWKAKGGDDYWYDLGEYSRSGQAIRDLIEFFRPRIESNDNYFREHIVYFSIEKDSYLTPYEQDQLDYDGYIQFPAKQLFIREEVAA